MTFVTPCGAERVKAGLTRATPWCQAVVFVCGRDVASHRFPLFRYQTSHTSIRGDLSLIPATAWRGCDKQIGKRLSERQWLIQASACRHSVVDTKSLVCVQPNGSGWSNNLVAFENILNGSSLPRVAANICWSIGKHNDGEGTHPYTKLSTLYEGLSTNQAGDELRLLSISEPMLHRFLRISSRLFVWF